MGIASRPLGVSVGPELSKQVSELLANWSKGDAEAREELMPQVYDELRKLAASHLRRERNDHTLQPTALVHEVYLRLAEQKNSLCKGLSLPCDALPCVSAQHRA